MISDRKKAAQKVTLIGAILDTLLGIAKVIVGALANSSALIADGIHSFSDLLTDFMVVAIFHFSSEEPDKDHPWGHARYETVGTVVLGCILIAIAGALAYENLSSLWSEEPAATPGWAAVIVAALSILGKEWIFRYTLAEGKRLKSDLLIANAWHSRTDAFSSIVVLVGVLAAIMGFPLFDAIAAIIVAGIVGKIGWTLTWQSIKELVDTALPEERVDALRKTVLAVEGVRSVHSFKSRNMGSKSLLEMHLQIAPRLSASEGHWIGDLAVQALLKEFDDISHIIFHIDTYDDQDMNFCRVLPQRSEIKKTLEDALDQIQVKPLDYQLTLHYLKERVELELMLSDTQQLAMTPSELSEKLNSALQPNTWFARLSVWHQ